MISIIPQSIVSNCQNKVAATIVQWNLLPLLRINKLRCRVPTPTYSKVTTKLLLTPRDSTILTAQFLT